MKNSLNFNKRINFGIVSKSDLLETLEFFMWYSDTFNIYVFSFYCKIYLLYLFSQL